MSANGREFFSQELTENAAFPIWLTAVIDKQRAGCNNGCQEKKAEG